MAKYSDTRILDAIAGVLGTSYEWSAGHDRKDQGTRLHGPRGRRDHATLERVGPMTYTQVQRVKHTDALTRAGELRRMADAATDDDTRRELQDAARDWVRHAERIANKMHARRARMGRI